MCKKLNKKNAIFAYRKIKKRNVMENNIAEILNSNLVTNITLLIMFVGMVAGIFAIVKFLFDLKKELTNLKIEVANLRVEFKDEITNLKVEVANVRIEFKDELTNVKVELANINTTLGIEKEQLAATNQRTDKLEIELKEQKIEIKEIKTEQKSFISRFFENVELPKVAL